MLLDAPGVRTAPDVYPLDGSDRPAGRGGVRDSAYRIAAIARHNLIIRRRDPGQMISYVAMPMILMLVLKPIYIRVVSGGDVQVVTGLLVMFSVFAIAIAGNSILVE